MLPWVTFLFFARKEPNLQSGCLNLAASPKDNGPRNKQIAFPDKLTRHSLEILVVKSEWHYKKRLAIFCKSFFIK